MVAVDHVVAAIDLVDVDRRQLVALHHRLVDARPALAHAPVDGQEAGVEVAGLGVGRDGADDLIDRDLLHAAKRAPLESRCAEHGLDRPQPLGATREEGTQRAPKRSRPRSIEVLNSADALYAQIDRRLTPDRTKEELARFQRRRRAAIGWP